MIRLLVSAVATIPILGWLGLLLTIAADPLPATGVTFLLVAYLIGWQRVDAGGGLPGRKLTGLGIPVAMAVAALLLAMAAAGLPIVDDPGVALFAATLGMAAAIGAVVVAIRPALRRD